MLLETLSTLSAGLFAVAAIYINMVEHPARMECGTELAVLAFGSSYRRGAVFMGALLVSGFFAATATWLTSSVVWWLVGASVLMAPVPFTLIAIFPLNKRLLDASLEKDSDAAVRLLTRWGRLHVVRSLLGLTSFLIFILLLVFATPK